MFDSFDIRKFVYLMQISQQPNLSPLNCLSSQKREQECRSIFFPYKHYFLTRRFEEMRCLISKSTFICLQDFCLCLVSQSVFLICFKTFFIYQNNRLTEYSDRFRIEAFIILICLQFDYSQSTAFDYEILEIDCMSNQQLLFGFWIDINLKFHVHIHVQLKSEICSFECQVSESDYFL